MAAVQGESPGVRQLGTPRRTADCRGLQPITGPCSNAGVHTSQVTAQSGHVAHMMGPQTTTAPTWQ